MVNAPFQFLPSTIKWISTNLTIAYQLCILKTTLFPWNTLEQPQSAQGSVPWRCPAKAPKLHPTVLDSTVCTSCSRCSGFVNPRKGFITLVVELQNISSVIGPLNPDGITSLEVENQWRGWGKGQHQIWECRGILFWGRKALWEGHRQVNHFGTSQTFHLYE